MVVCGLEERWKGFGSVGGFWFGFGLLLLLDGGKSCEVILYEYGLCCDVCRCRVSFGMEEVGIGSYGLGFGLCCT